MTNTWDDEDRAIARALDAAPDAATTGADEQAVDAYREVLGALPNSEVTPRPELEDQMVAAALRRRPATVPTVAGHRARRTRNIRLVALTAATVAAAIVVGVIVNNGSSGGPVPGGHIALATVQRADVEAIKRSPGARVGTFDPAVGQVVLARARGGTGAVYALTDAAPLSIGLVGKGGTTVVGPARPVAGIITFVVDRPDRVTAVTLIRDGTEIAKATLTPA
jgi:hypothetical protein